MLGSARQCTVVARAPGMFAVRGCRATAGEFCRSDRQRSPGALFCEGSQMAVFPALRAVGQGDLECGIAAGRMWRLVHRAICRRSMAVGHPACRPDARQLDGWTTPRSDHGCRECGVGCRAKDRVSRDGCNESSMWTKPSVPGGLLRHVRVPLACLVWALRQDEQQRFIAGNSHLPTRAAPETNRR